MATWAEFETAAPDLAAAGRRLFDRDGIGQALLGTVRGDGLPRIHPIYVAVVEDRLVTVLLGSPKRTDLLVDGRYAIHTHQDPAAPDELELRGRARVIDDPATRAAIVAGWAFEAGPNDVLFEFDIERALLGQRATADDWPPRYSSWAAPGD